MRLNIFSDGTTVKAGNLCHIGKGSVAFKKKRTIVGCQCFEVDLAGTHLFNEGLCGREMRLLGIKAVALFNKDAPSALLQLADVSWPSVVGAKLTVDHLFDHVGVLWRLFAHKALDGVA